MCICKCSGEDDDDGDEDENVLRQEIFTTNICFSQSFYQFISVILRMMIKKRKKMKMIKLMMNMKTDTYKHESMTSCCRRRSHDRWTVNAALWLAASVPVTLNKNHKTRTWRREPGGDEKRCLYMSTCLCMSQCISTCLRMSLCVYMSQCFSLCLCVTMCLFTFLYLACIYVSVCLYVFSTCLSVSLLVSVCISVSTCLYPYMSLCRNVSPCVFPRLCVYLHVSAFLIVSLHELSHQTPMSFRHERLLRSDK